MLLGVENDGQISGVKRDRREEWVANACREKIEPPIFPDLSWARNVEGGHDILAIHVPTGPDKPYACVHNGRKTYYARMGSTCREESRADLQRIFPASGGLHYGLRPVPGATFSAFDIRRLTNYFQHVRQEDIPNENDLIRWEEILCATNLMTIAAAQRIATVDGLLLFGRDPYSYLPQSGIRAVCHFGTEPDYTTRADEELRGPIVPLVTSSGIVLRGLVEKALNFVQANTQAESRVVDGRSVSRWDYPEEVIREVVVNALVHRDYRIAGTDIMLSIYSGRLEVVSPGRLPNMVTVEGVKYGMQYSRNQTLSNVLRDYGYFEGYGMGLAATVIPSMRAHNGTEPDFISAPNRFTVRLWKG